MINQQLETLQSLMDKADLDAALKEVLGKPINCTPEVGDLVSLVPLRLANFHSEVLDYGGRYDDAALAIAPYGERAKAWLKLFTCKPVEHLSDADAALCHQFCYVLINGGMCIYRHAKYDREEFYKANELFTLAERALAFLEKLGLRHRGAVSRVWYCLGLIHRELYRYLDARGAFAKSIEAGAQALAEGNDPGHRRGRYQFAMSRCYGLGNAWISYTEASLSEAKCHIVAARLLLPVLSSGTPRFITAYIDMVYATILLSSDASDSTIQQGIGILELAYKTLGGDEAVQKLDVGHGPYAIRVANELASAYLRLGQRCTGGEHNAHCAKALEFAAKVRQSVHACYDNRSACKSHVLESRVHRENRDYKKALESAELALRAGGNHEFSRVDCWLTLGEAKFYDQDYSGAVLAFEEALKYGSTNRKIFAACHLHLSRTYLTNDEPAKARRHFDMWESTGRALENAFIRELKAEVESGLKNIDRDFILSAMEPNLKADAHIKSLRRWLARLALSRTGNDNVKAAAAALDVAENTVANWLWLDAEAKPRRRRTRRG